jgi:protein-arginine kinase activator protein McsA
MKCEKCGKEAAALVIHDDGKTRRSLCSDCRIELLATYDPGSKKPKPSPPEKKK